jgi:pimeloyl-ACP methyl ester carboxylesterase
MWSVRFQPEKAADSGHLSTLEQPTAVTKALVEWLKS